MVTSLGAPAALAGRLIFCFKSSLMQTAPSEEGG